MLELKTAVIRNVLDVEVKGALDSQSASDFKAWILEKNVAGYTLFALNCRNLEFISSRGISSLIEVHRVLSARKGAVVLYYVRNEVLNLLDFLKISGQIPVLSNLEQVLANYGPHADAPDAETEKVGPQGGSEGSPNGGAEEALDESQLPADSPELPYSPRLTRPPEEESQEEVVSLEANDEGLEAPQTAKAPPPQPEASQGAETSANLKSRPTPSEVLEEARVSSTGVPAGVVEGDDRYIDLSSASDLEETSESINAIIVFCPNCGESLKVKVAGQYLCPECRSKFHYPFD